MENIQIKIEVEDNEHCIIKNEEIYYDVQNDYTSELAVHPVKCEYVGESNPVDVNMDEIEEIIRPTEDTSDCFELTDARNRKGELENENFRRLIQNKYYKIVNNSLYTGTLENGILCRPTDASGKKMAISYPVLQKMSGVNMNPNEGVIIKQEVGVDPNMQQTADSGCNTLEEQQQETKLLQLIRPIKSVTASLDEVMLWKFICVTCNKGYGCNSGLNGHWKSYPAHKEKGKVTMGPQQLLKCSGCMKDFKYRRSLRRHWKLIPSHREMGNYKSGRQDVFECQTCNKAYIGRMGLIHHFRLNPGHRKYECLIEHIPANLHKSSQPMVAQHIKRSTSQPGKVPFGKYKCAGCNKGYDSKWGISRHWNEYPLHKENGKVILQKLQFKCSECHKQYVARKSLSRHWKLNPSHREKTMFGQKRFIECAVCNNGYFGRIGLRRHIKKNPSHAEQNWKRLLTQYICGVCKKECSGAGGLGQHWKENPSHKNKKNTSFQNLRPEDETERSAQRASGVVKALLTSLDAILTTNRNNSTQS